MGHPLKPYQVFVIIGAATSFLLIVLLGLGFIWNICYVGTDGYSFYVGNGYIEYGYDWAWIRRRMFHDGGPNYGWTIKRSLPPIPGVTPPDPDYSIPVLLSFLVDFAVTLDVWKRRRIWDPPPHRYLFPIVLWGIVEIPIVIKLFEPWGVPDGYRVTVSLFLATITVLIPIASMKVIDKLLARWRVPKGHCQKCRYNLTGNISGICPECGTPIVVKADV